MKPAKIRTYRNIFVSSRDAENGQRYRRKGREKRKTVWYNCWNRRTECKYFLKKQKSLEEVEKRIYTLESRHMDELGLKHSVLRGWEGIFADATHHRATSTTQDADRIFSRSSTTFTQVVIFRLRFKPSSLV